MEAGITRVRMVALAALVALLAFGGSLAAAQSATAAPKLLAPGNGKVLARGSQPTFKLRDTSPNARRYSIFMRISTSKKVDRNGTLKRTKIGHFARMDRKGKFGFVWKPEDYSFPEWFMQRPGTYYWQAYHIDCSVRGCNVESKVRSFKVR